MATSGTLSAKQTAAIAALLDPAHSSVTAAAKAAGVPLRTMHRWFGDEAFVTALRQAEGEALDAATMRLVSVVTPAVHVFVNIMADKSNPPGVRLRAAQMVIDSTVRLRELRNVEMRLAALEAAYVNKVD